MVLYLKFLWDAVKFNFMFYLAVISIVLLWTWAWGITFLELVLILVGASFLRLYIMREYGLWSYVKTLLTVVGFVSLFWFAPRLIGWWFIWVLLGGFVAYRFFKGRKIFMSSMRFVETKLFGKPLDKKEWSKKEKVSIYELDAEEEEDERKRA